LVIHRFFLFTSRSDRSSLLAQADHDREAKKTSPSSEKKNGYKQRALGAVIVSGCWSLSRNTPRQPTLTARAPKTNPETIHVEASNKGLRPIPEQAGTQEKNNHSRSHA